MTRTLLALSTLLVTLVAGCHDNGSTMQTSPPRPDSPADLLVTGATIITGGPAGVIENGAILVRDGRIVSVGPRDAAEPEARGAKRIDATGMTVTAGLVDAHGHLGGLGASLEEVDLVGTVSYDEVIGRLAARAKELPAGTWVQGRGWDQNDWDVKDFPSAGPLDRAIPDHPVIASRIDGHAVLANSAAMKIAGVTTKTPDPAGGRIVRAGDGSPTGVFVDNAEGLVANRVPPPTREDRKRRLRKAAEYIASQGLTGMHDAGASQVTIDILRELIDEHALPIRVYAMLTDQPDLLVSWFAKGPLIDYGGRLTVRSIKLYADGALGSRGAALLAPYRDDPANVGLLVSPPEHIETMARAARAAGFQACTHAIGDRGNRVAIEAYENAGVTPADRFRIEHLQVIALEDIPRLARIGVIASMQPTHCTSDMPWAEARIGPDRVKGAYAWRRLLDTGARLAFGSDFPVEQVNPILGLHAAVNRTDKSGSPAGGWYPDQKLSPMEAIEGFTTGAAWAAFEEGDRGTIEPGKVADLSILDANPLAIDPANIWKIKPMVTIVGGEVVWSAPRE